MGELEKALKLLNKKFGEGYIGLGSKLLDKEYKRHSMGNFALDFAIGGGLPERKVMMIAGQPSSGKTSTMLTAIAEVQRRGGKAAIIDMEHSFDAVWATKLGVNPKELYIVQSKAIEDASDAIETLIMTGELDLICLDSVAAAMSSKELDESSEKKSMGGKAKAIGLMIGKITARLNDVSNVVKTSIIIINQVRANISGYGNPLYTPGGMQLHFQTDIIVWLRKESEPVGGKDNPVGITVKLRVEKNRTFPPFKTASYELLFIEGRVNNPKAIVEKAMAYGIVKRSGAWYEYGDIKAQGIEKCLEEIVAKGKLDTLRDEVLKLKDVAIDPNEEIVAQLNEMEA